MANSFDNDYKLTINFDEEIKDYDMYLSMLKRVKNGEPYQYVIGKASFLGNDYYVDKNVLIPRQETEQLVLQTKELIKSKFINREIAICDMCTGSGIIGNELHKEFPDANIYLTDISKEALEIAKKNTLSNSENLTFLLGSMVDPLIEKGIKIYEYEPGFIHAKNMIADDLLFLKSLNLDMVGLGPFIPAKNTPD